MPSLYSTKHRELCYATNITLFKSLTRIPLGLASSVFLSKVRQMSDESKTRLDEAKMAPEAAKMKPKCAKMATQGHQNGSK